MYLSFMNYNQRYTFRADIVGPTLNEDYAASIGEDLYKPAIVLAKVCCLDPDGHFQPMADKVMVNYGKRLAKLGQLTKGETIQFKARIVSTWINASREELRNPTKISIIKPLVKERYPVPDSEKLRVGYIMEVNGSMNGQPYDSHLVHQYDNWCDIYGSKKGFATDQSNAKPSTTIRQNRCHKHYGTDSNQMEGACHNVWN